MANLSGSLFNLRYLDDLARHDSIIHRLHPLSKLITAIVYITTVISFDRYEISGLVPLVFFPVLVAVLADLPLKPLLARLLIIEPFIIGIGILNPLFDQEIIMIGNLSLVRGWLTFASLLIKSTLTVSAALLLVSTTGMDKLAASLRMFKVPKIFIVQLQLTYRYISVLLEEGSRMVRAYKLRSPGSRGIEIKAWGSFAGQLLLRTIDRAERVYQAMCLRGFTGEYYMNYTKGISGKDVAFICGWTAFFIIVRLYDIPMLLGIMLTGVIN